MHNLVRKVPKAGATLSGKVQRAAVRLSDKVRSRARAYANRADLILRLPSARTVTGFKVRSRRGIVTDETLSRVVRVQLNPGPSSRPRA